jgi:hypothetical protein
MPNTYVIDISAGRRVTAIIGAATFALFVVGQAHTSAAQETGAKTYSSPAEAAGALLQAVQNQDEAEVQAILGAGREVTSTGDDGIDKLERDQFVQKYQEMHRLVREPDGTTVLYIGAENWPFPIPLTSADGKWSFDAKTGSQEILFRRIGENEATATEVCRTLVNANAQADTQADSIGQYARTLVSAGTTTPSTSEPAPAKEPFHGYYFRAVAPQPVKASVGTSGSRASGGKKMNGGVAFVAYPAEYRSSGVMTFVVMKDGAVYEKDLGPESAKLAQDIQQRPPTSGWNPVN